MKSKWEAKTWIRALLPTVFDLAIPSVIFYGLRAVGVGAWWALVLGGLAVAVRVVWGIVKERRVNGIALFALSMLVLGNVVSLLTGDPRLLLARESWITSIVGLWMLGSLFAKRPVLFTGAKLMMPTQEAREEWENSWQQHPEFRHVMRVSTVIWAGLLLADTVVRIVMAYTLPIDVVPALTIAQTVVLILIMHYSTRAYGRMYAARRKFRMEGRRFVRVEDEVSA
ncbi:VC0807 family protein [Fodinicola acaciae]|uniref:VC0807 family protein n=1 Tax=Fodinicola acaciae TaxID=2681555 RepID=UPI0013D36E55|nr:VC0807 family protein [Fodinicola acaciae]